MNLQCDGKEAELQRHLLPIEASESGASWLAERTPMMQFVLCMCRATWCQPCAAADGAQQETPVSNRGPSIRHCKKDIVGERGLLKTAFPMNITTADSESGRQLRTERKACGWRGRAEAAAHTLCVLICFPGASPCVVLFVPIVHATCLC